MDMNGKKILCVILAAALLAGVLGGCAAGGAAGSAETTMRETTEAAATEPTTEAPTEPETVPTTAPTEAPTEPVEWPEEGPWLYAGRAFVYDCKAQDYRYVYGDLRERIYPASITKLMCALVAEQYLPRDMELTVGDEIYMIVKKASTAGLQEGDVLTVEMVMRALLIPSGCEAAYVLALNAGRIIAGDPNLDKYSAVDVFVEQMNLEAQKLGLVDSSFCSPDGRHNDNHYICMEDFVKIGEAALGVDLIMDTVGLSHATIELRNREGFDVESTNPHIDETSDYYIPTCVGLKTGSHYMSDYCLLSAYWVEDRYVLMGVFGSYESEPRAKDTFNLYQMYGQFPE